MKPTTHSSCNSKASRLAIPVQSFSLVLILSLASPTTSCSEREKSSLYQFVAELSSDGGLIGFSNWTVTDVSLPSRGLQGHISPSLGNLTGLLRLNLSSNMLSGGLPKELVYSNSIIVLDELQSSTLRPLQVLNISSNFFTGRFPSTTWELMKNLISLNASNNSFTGQIPAMYCVSAPSFSLLDLSYNQFSGSIPPGLGNCSMMTSLSAGSNNLSGTVPDEIFNLTLLEHLSVPNNQLEGSLRGISKLKNLITLDLGGNSLSGNVPESIGELKRLEELHLDHNNMSGELPSTLSNCTNLMIIDLKSNSFSGELTNVLALNHCSLSGKIPFWLSKLRNLEVLLLYGNQLTGPVPDWINSLSFLFHINLSNNSLVGVIPTELVDMPMLKADKVASKAFELPVYKSQSRQFRGHNKLTGAIPQSICNLTNLEALDLSSNHLTGSIPIALNNLHFLSRFNISNNDLEGPIPTTGQLSTFPSSSFDGNPKLCGPMLAHHCNSAEAIFPTKRTGDKVEKVIFAIAFSAFFGVGVLYDQIVLSKVFG
ncbi:hypothetical protein HU200_043985 [Digitaria exilis]|uniref:Uncharacterized protein n=1 Tax=Digitaria exilis TaxID=1010633 RepID=A0A835AZP0_9POAL|nr:hypothetical protein HU200_043985 [Digitaria exilis]